MLDKNVSSKPFVSMRDMPGVIVYPGRDAILYKLISMRIEWTEALVAGETVGIRQVLDILDELAMFVTGEAAT
jgi:hypothetical protein